MDDWIGPSRSPLLEPPLETGPRTKFSKNISIVINLNEYYDELKEYYEYYELTQNFSSTKNNIVINLLCNQTYISNVHIILPIFLEKTSQEYILK